MLRILTFTTLFPNAAMPQHGIFVRERLRHLVASGEVRATVIAPVPWFPSDNPRFGRYAQFARVPRREVVSEIPVFHPRYPVVPKVGMTVAPALLAAAALRALKRVAADVGPFDLIDAHYMYPDGVAAAVLGRLLDRPVVITARGTDLNLIPAYRLPRAMIVWAAHQAAAVVTVSDALRRILIGLGVPGDRVHTLRNGVDLSLFRPVADRTVLRSSLGLSGTWLLSVGNLLETKGHHQVIRALRQLPRDTGLLVAGEGPYREALETEVRAAGLAGRVRLLGRLSHAQLVEYYNAADALVLASVREGMPNVLLESLGCGTPVVATNVGGASEVVDSADAGELVESGAADAVADAVRRLLRRAPSRTAVRRHAERFSWDATTAGQIALFRRAVEQGRP